MPKRPKRKKRRWTAIKFKEGRPVKLGALRIPGRTASEIIADVQRELLADGARARLAWRPPSTPLDKELGRMRRAGEKPPSFKWNHRYDRSLPNPWLEINRPKR